MHYKFKTWPKLQKETMTRKPELTTPIAGHTSRDFAAVWVLMDMRLHMAEVHLRVIECLLTIIPIAGKCTFQIWYNVSSNRRECATL
jgi:hypothetical protein